MKYWATPAATGIAIHSGFMGRPHAVSARSARVAEKTIRKVPGAMIVKVSPPLPTCQSSRQSARLPTILSHSASQTTMVRGERGVRRKVAIMGRLFSP
ncbi:MAG: hypothetical protein ABI330_21310 [Caldimonas sp.]